MSQSDDMTAIDTFIHSVPLNTDKAKGLFTDWVTWYTNLSWYGRTQDSSNYDIARNKRNAFELANAQSDDEKAQIKAVQTKGVSTEQAKGQPDRRDAEGNIIPPPSVPWYKKLTLIQKAVLGLAASVTGIAVIRKL